MGCCASCLRAQRSGYARLRRRRAKRHQGAVPPWCVLLYFAFERSFAVPVLASVALWRGASADCVAFYNKALLRAAAPSLQEAHAGEKTILCTISAELRATLSNMQTPPTETGGAAPPVLALCNEPSDHVALRAMLLRHSWLQETYHFTQHTDRGVVRARTAQYCFPPPHDRAARGADRPQRPETAATPRAERWCWLKPALRVAARCAPGTSCAAAPRTLQDMCVQFLGNRPDAEARTDAEAELRNLVSILLDITGPVSLQCGPAALLGAALLTDCSDPLYSERPPCALRCAEDAVATYLPPDALLAARRFCAMHAEECRAQDATDSKRK